MTNRISHIRYWRCPNCGQVRFGDSPPDMCAVCDDFTTWQPLSDHNSSPDSLDQEVGGQPTREEPPLDRQLPLFGD